MPARRTTRLLPLHHAIWLFAAFITALTLTPSDSLAADVWPFEWRPGWVPGDPVEEPILFTWATSPASGLFVAIDPVTRRPVAPSLEQRQAFDRGIALDAFLAPAAPVVIEALPGGGEIAHLNGSFHSFSIARRDASGRFVTDCAADAETARRLLATPVVTAPKKEER